MIIRKRSSGYSALLKRSHCPALPWLSWNYSICRLPMKVGLALNSDYPSESAFQMLRLKACDITPSYSFWFSETRILLCKILAS